MISNFGAHVRIALWGIPAGARFRGSGGTPLISTPIR